MGKQITPMKRAFAANYAVTKSVVEAAKAAGYANYKSCYRLVKTDENGTYTDPVIRALLARADVNVGLVPVAKVVNIATRRPAPPPTFDDAFTLDSMLREMARVARDETFPAGPRVQVLMFLVRHFQEAAAVSDEPDDKVLADVKALLGIA